MNVYECNYYIWGTGKKAQQVNESCKLELGSINILGYIDNDIKKEGTVFWGKKIYSPDVLKNDHDSRIIILNKYYDEIVEQINRDYPYCKNHIQEKTFLKRLQVLSRYKNSGDPKLKELVNYLIYHPLGVFNYSFTEKYNEDDISVYFDEKIGLFYVYYFGKKMYMSREYRNEEQVKRYCNSVLLEQDIESPHRYITDQFNVKENSVVVDAGVAEGNFSLLVVEKVKKIYMFEPDERWVEALNYTFEPYKDKVVIINKCVSNYVNDFTTMIDNVVAEDLINFIKMDIEGEELYALQGAQNHLLQVNDIKCVVCTYHQEYAYDAIMNFLEKLNFSVEPSEGYMWFPSHYNEMRPPVLRRGLIRANKGTEDDK